MHREKSNHGILILLLNLMCLQELTLIWFYLTSNYRRKTQQNSRNWDRVRLRNLIMIPNYVTTLWHLLLFMIERVALFYWHKLRFITIKAKIMDELLAVQLLNRLIILNIFFYWIIQDIFKWLLLLIHNILL